MEDSEILELYRQRSEDAIARTDKKYGRYLYSIAYRILRDNGETEECVNETYFKTWNTIPPQFPQNLATFIGKIVRHTAFDVFRAKYTQKRGSGEVNLVLSELEECIGNNDVEEELERKETLKVITEFLDNSDVQKRRMFILRYWYVMSVKEIAEKFGMTESNVKVTLHRMRDGLKKELMKNGLI